MADNSAQARSCHARKHWAKAAGSARDNGANKVALAAAKGWAEKRAPTVTLPRVAWLERPLPKAMRD